MRKLVFLLMFVVALTIIVVPVLAADKGPDVVPVFDDSRINNSDVAAPVVVYGTDFDTGRGLELWVAGFEGVGTLVLTVTPEEIAAVPALPEEPMLIDAVEDMSIMVYRLPSGEFQVQAGCNSTEWYFLTFEVLGPNVGYESHFYK